MKNADYRAWFDTRLHDKLRRFDIVAYFSRDKISQKLLHFYGYFAY